MSQVLIFNAIISMLAAVMCTYVVLNPRIHEGLWVKGGMIIITISLLVSAVLSFTDAELEDHTSSAFVLRVGILITCIGYALKHRFKDPGDSSTQ